MKVQLISYTPDADKLIASAAKLCYSPVGVDEIGENLTPENTEKFVKMLMNLSHSSPLEHASFTFAIEGVSRALTHQLVRHRIASYSQQSQRYVKLEDFQYIIPPAIESNPKAKEIYIKAMEEDKKTYDELTNILMEEKIKKYLEEGIEEKKARQIAEKESIEDARYVFPNACETKIVVTMNLRTLIHFFELRCCNRAQWEIRNLAIEMLRLLKGVYPSLFVMSGPGCVTGPCPEGAMTCGKAKEVREFFKNL